MITLTLSDAPVANSAAIDSQKILDIAKTKVASPKPATASNRLRHGFISGGRSAHTRTVSKAPITGATSSIPTPSGPTRNMSSANTGNSATTTNGKETV